MPWVEGESLRARLDREKQLPVDDALRMATVSRVREPGTVPVLEQTALTLRLIMLK
jgi:hypothetical protein